MNEQKEFGFCSDHLGIKPDACNTQANKFFNDIMAILDRRGSYRRGVEMTWEYCSRVYETLFIKK